MNLNQLTTIKKSLQTYLQHLTERDSFCDLVDDKNPDEIKILEEICNLCDRVCIKYQELHNVP